MSEPKPYHEEFNHLLNLSQAAFVLGYRDYRRIEELIENGHLQAYHIGNSKRFKIRYHEVMQIPQKTKPSQKTKQVQNNKLK